MLFRKKEMTPSSSEVNFQHEIEMLKKELKMKYLIF